MSIDFGKKLKSLRAELMITQSEIARALNTTKGTISKWENNILEPNIETIKKLASFLEISIDELLDYDSHDYLF